MPVTRYLIGHQWLFFCKYIYKLPLESPGSYVLLWWYYVCIRATLHDVMAAASARRE